MDLAAFMDRVKARCAQHRGPTAGFSSLCFRLELEDHIASEHPEIKRDDVIQLVDAWLLAADRPAN